MKAAMLHGDPNPRPAPIGAALNAAMRLRGAPTAPEPPTAATEPSGDDDETGPPKTPSKEPALRRRTASESFNSWLQDVLGPKRGVVASLPKQAWNEPGTVMSCIVALDNARMSGQGAWWLHRLRASTDLEEPTYTAAGAAVYRSVGLEGVPWFPTEKAYGAEGNAFELLSAAGIAVVVREVPAWPKESKTLSGLPLLSQRLLLELEAAACAAGPAVFAAMLVHEGDRFDTIRESALASGALDAGDDYNAGARRIAALVSVTQTHSFTLRDMLTGHATKLGDPVARPGVHQASLESTIYEATSSIARKLRFLARNRILKINQTPDTVVFCPRLVEGADGELEATGYTYPDPLRGCMTRACPMLADFDPVFSRRGPEVDPDCAYALMVLVLLASVRAVHGDVSTVMLHRLTGKSIDGAALPEGELPERWDEISLPTAMEGAKAGVGVFCSMLRSAASMADAADDFEALLNCKVLLGGSMYRPVFTSLVCRLTGSTNAYTDLFAPARSRAEANAERERVGRLRRRLDAVRMARIARLLERE